MSPSEKASTPTQDQARPFRVECLTWSESEWEQALKLLHSIPCIHGAENAGDILRTIDQLRRYRGISMRMFMGEVKPISPAAVIQRYNGEDWSYWFHEQGKYDLKRGRTYDFNHTESNITGIAKRIVHGMAKMIRGGLEEIDQEMDVIEKKMRERELENRVDNFLAEFYFKEGYDNVDVTELQGPRGPVYLSNAGNHRLAAARLIGMSRIRASVSTVPNSKAAHDEWFEFLALLPQPARHQVTNVYNKIYPCNAKQKRDEAKALKQAQDRLPFIQATLDRQKKIGDKKDEIKNEKIRKRNKKFEWAEQLIKKFELESRPDWKSLIHTVAYHYLFVEAKDPYMEKHFTGKMDADGRLEPKPGEHNISSSVLGIDLNMWTWNEIRVRAVQEYLKRHPEIAPI
ncbi:hypothetical protein EXS71_01665 [Candidatus Uhrbacteria bacterium]|nr:hypothetical protein [Candidatus Uhrbacteria bacterium]